MDRIKPKPKDIHLRRKTIGIAALGLLFLFGLTGCVTAESQKTITSVNTYQFDQSGYRPLSTTDLKMEVKNGQITSIENPPLPCGMETAPPEGEIDARQQLCFSLELILNAVGITPSKAQIEKLASEIVIVPQEDIPILCNGDAKTVACYLDENGKIITVSVDPVTIIHEETHKQLEEELEKKYFDSDKNMCFINLGEGSLVIIYQNPTGFKRIFVDQELFSSLAEQFFKEKMQSGNVMTPMYLQIGNPDPRLLDTFEKLGKQMAEDPNSNFVIPFYQEGRVSFEDFRDSLTALFGEDLTLYFNAFNQAFAMYFDQVTDETVAAPLIEETMSPQDACQ